MRPDEVLKGQVCTRSRSVKSGVLQNPQSSASAPLSANLVTGFVGGAPNATAVLRLSAGFVAGPAQQLADRS
jgi:hypothetical protein